MNRNEIFEVEVTRDTRGRRTYWSSRRTVDVSVRNPVPYGALLRQIRWKDGESSYSLKKPALSRLESESITDVGDLVWIYENNYRFIEDMVKNTQDFGKVGEMYLAATVEAATDDESELLDFGWPYSVQVGLPGWIREDLLPELEGNGLDREEIQRTIREAAQEAFEDNLLVTLKDSVVGLLNDAVDRKRDELEDERARKSRVQEFFEREERVYEV